MHTITHAVRSTSHFRLMVRQTILRAQMPRQSFSSEPMNSGETMSTDKKRRRNQLTGIIRG